MSATGQGQAAGEAAQQANGNGGEGEAQAGPDLAALSGQLEQLAGGQEELRQFLAGNPWQQQAEGEQQEQQSPEVDLGFLDPDSPDFDPAQMSEKLTGAVGEYVQQAIQQANAPVLDQMQEMKRESAMRDLVEEFPEMGDPAVNAEVVKVSQDYAALLGQPKLGSDPLLWRLVYAAGRAFNAAAEEGSGDPGAAHLEGGGGPSAGAQSQADQAKKMADSIFSDTKKGSRVLPFN